MRDSTADISFFNIDPKERLVDEFEVIWPRISSFCNTHGQKIGTESFRVHSHGTGHMDVNNLSLTQMRALILHAQSPTEIPQVILSIHVRRLLYMAEY